MKFKNKSLIMGTSWAPQKLSISNRKNNKNDVCQKPVTHGHNKIATFAMEIQHFSKVAKDNQNHASQKDL